jgi:hypothetical protein
VVIGADRFVELTVENYQPLCHFGASPSQWKLTAIPDAYNPNKNTGI